jgi:hypothetical protein
VDWLAMNRMNIGPRRMYTPSWVGTGFHALLCSYDIPFNFGFTLVGQFIERYPWYFHVYSTNKLSILQISHYLRVIDLLIVFLFIICMEIINFATS